MDEYGLYENWYVKMWTTLFTKFTGTPNTTNHLTQTVLLSFLLRTIFRLVLVIGSRVLMNQTRGWRENTTRLICKFNFQASFKVPVDHPSAMDAYFNSDAEDRIITRSGYGNMRHLPALKMEYLCFNSEDRSLFSRKLVYSRRTNYLYQSSL